jgi:hypothetical protein
VAVGNGKQLAFVATVLPGGPVPDANTTERKLTDRYLQSLKGAENGVPYDVRDTDVRGLRVRVMGTGERTSSTLSMT